MWVGEMLLHRTWVGWREAQERGLAFLSELSDGKSESFPLQVFSCRVPGLCTHPPLPHDMAFYFSESSRKVQPFPCSAEQGKSGARQPHVGGSAFRAAVWHSLASNSWMEMGVCGL